MFDLPGFVVGAVLLLGAMVVVYKFGRGNKFYDQG